MKNVVAGQKYVVANVKEEIKMEKKIVIAAVVGEGVSSAQLLMLNRSIMDYLEKQNVNAADVIIAGKRAAVDAAGQAVKDAEIPVRLIGCLGEPDEVFEHVRPGARYITWAVDHADVVMTAGRGPITATAAQKALRDGKDCYSHVNKLEKSICENTQYKKETIKKNEIISRNSQPVVTEVKAVVKETKEETKMEKNMMNNNVNVNAVIENELKKVRAAQSATQQSIARARAKVAAAQKALDEAQAALNAQLKAAAAAETKQAKKLAILEKALADCQAIDAGEEVVIEEAREEVIAVPVVEDQRAEEADNVAEEIEVCEVSQPVNETAAQPWTEPEENNVPVLTVAMEVADEEEEVEKKEDCPVRVTGLKKIEIDGVIYEILLDAMPINELAEMFGEYSKEERADLISQTIEAGNMKVVCA